MATPALVEVGPACRDAQRRADVLAHPVLNGIDFVEYERRSLPQPPHVLVVTFLKSLPDPPSSDPDGAYGLTLPAMRWFWDHYLGGADGRHPEASPLRAESLAGVAPALVVVCEFDPLRDEGVAYAERLREAGVPVRLSEYEGMIHGFIRMPALIDRSQDLLDELGRFLAGALSRGGD